MAFMGFHDTDREWKRWGESNPYFAVLADNKYRNGENIPEFFETGRKYFEEIIKTYEDIGRPLSKLGSALDFGCGVGRVLIPMTEYFARTIGVDVSQLMLMEARKNIKDNKLELRHFDGRNITPCIVKESYHFMHSVLVFQHIRPKRGFQLMRS